MPLRTPPLRDAHETAGATFTDFGGWEMPVEFGSIREEHAAVRDSVGRFDVSHMGEVLVEGPDAGRLCQRLTVNDVAALSPGEAQYSAVTDADGVLLDDVVVYRFADEQYLFIPNAGHDEEMTRRWETHRDRWDLDATVENVTDDRGLIAVQGPDAAARVAAAAAEGEAVEALGRFEVVEAEVGGVPCRVSRTGYTGEDGFEVLAAADGVGAVWDAFDCQPCGLGARDTLRMEMGFLLSGQDFDPADNPRTPFEVGLGFAVALDTDFVGRDALAEVEAEGVAETFVGFRLLDRGVPRAGYAVTDADGTAVGTVTSGTMSPTLSEPIGLGYVPVEHADPGTELQIEIRGEGKAARVVEPPFLEGYT